MPKPGLRAFQSLNHSPMLRFFQQFFVPGAGNQFDFLRVVHGGLLLEQMPENKSDNTILFTEFFLFLMYYSSRINFVNTFINFFDYRIDFIDREKST